MANQRQQNVSPIDTKFSFFFVILTHLQAF